MNPYPPFIKECIVAVAKKHLESVYIRFHNSDHSASYIATNKLNTANLPKEFMIVPKRTNDKSTDIKLHWDKLNRTLHGVRTPHENKGWISRRFNELKKQGWVVIRNVAGGNIYGH